MKKKTVLILLLLAFVVLLGGSSVLYSRLGQSAAPGQMAAQENYALAPDFTVYDADGNAVSLSDYFGTPIVLNFWASWCGPCKSEMPEFHEKSLELEGQVQFLMVNMTTSQRESREKAAAYIAESGFTFPVLYDLDSSAAITYSVTSLPTTYFLDAEGRAVAWAAGAIDSDLLQKGIDMILPPEA